MEEPLKSGEWCVTKVCTMCKLEKPLTDFCLALHARRDGKRKNTKSVCKKCASCSWKTTKIEVKKDKKVCAKCNIEKLASDFYPKSYRTKRGIVVTLASWCKDCCQEPYRSGGSYNARKNELKRLNHRKDPRRILLQKAKHRAKVKGVPFDLQLEDIVIPQFCPALGLELSVNDVIHGRNSPTIDRMIPEKGYVKSNISILSHLANTLKNNASVDELRAIARYIKERTT